MFNFLKREGIAFFAAIAFAFSLFEGFSSFLEFCQWLRPLVYHWRIVIYGFFDLIFFFLPFKMPRFLIDLIVLGALVYGFLTKGERAWKQNSISNEVTEISVKKDLYFKLYVPGALIVGGFFLLPIFGAVEDGSEPGGWEGIEEIYEQLILAIRFFAFFVLTTIVLLFRAKSFSGMFKEMQLSRHLWRTASIVLSLVSINYVGLYHDEINRVSRDDIIHRLPS